MRVLLIGPAAGRLRLRAMLPDGVEVAGEARSLAAARSIDVDADAWLVQPDAPAGRNRSDDVDPLTPRELDVLDLLAQGLSNKTIAARLAISDQTVKVHVASICAKLGAANRTDAVRRAVRQGLVVL